MEMRLPPSIAVVVDSDVIGVTAVSVPARPLAGGDGGSLLLSIDPADVEDAVEGLEQGYLDSHETKGTDAVVIDKQALADAASRQVLVGDTTWDEIAGDCGWTREDDEYASGRRGDGQKVRELLGLAGGKNDRKRDLTFDEANALIKSVGLDPVEIGL